MNELQLATLKRFLRAFVPQVPAVIASVLQYQGAVPLPEWVVPAFIFVGAVFTALDKLLRALRVY